MISYHSLEDRIVKRLMAGEHRPEVLLSQKESGSYRLHRRRALHGHGNQGDFTPWSAECSQPHAEMVGWALQVLHKKVSCCCCCIETFSVAAYTSSLSAVCDMPGLFLVCRPSLQDLMRCPAIHEQDQQNYELQSK